MSRHEDCHIFDLWNEGQVDPREWAEHRERCPVCRAQATLDRELRRQLGTLSRPRLSPGFERRLLAQVSSTRRGAGRDLRGWMYAYWLAAGIASFVLLARAGATDGAGNGLTLLVVAALASVLARGFGVDLVELVWWTAEAPNRGDHSNHIEYC